MPFGFDPRPGPARHWTTIVILTLALHTSTPPNSAIAANDYPLTADSLPHEGVPQGRLIDGAYSSTNTLFPGTTRTYTLYVPAQYDGKSPAPLMVFQDGKGLADAWKVPTAFDNLIHKKELPPIIGVFISPGVVPSTTTNVLPRYNRSLEYDSPGNRYSRFLIEEFLPWIERAHNLVFTPNASGRAIAGASSGAIAAFVAAWERPDSFSRVFSSIGSYVGLRGGDALPILVRKTEPRPIRIFLQDGSNDQDIYGGNWWLANQEMLSALSFAGYEVQHAWGDGGHDSKQAAAIFPEAVRWLWRDFPKPIPASTTSLNPFLSQILIPGEPWSLVTQGHLLASPTANPRGEIFVADPAAARILKIGTDGKESVFAEDTGNSEALMFGAEGRLYSLAAGQQRIVRYDEAGHPELLAEGFHGTDIVTLPIGAFFTDPDNRKIWRLGGGAAIKETEIEIGHLSGIAISPDHSLLYAADASSRWVWSFLIQSDGSLTLAQPFFYLHVPDPAVDAGADGMAVDTDGRLYVTTRMGLQVCDQAGRVNAIIPTPDVEWLSGVCFGGPENNTLFVACGNKLFKRKTKAHGSIPWGPPTTPAQPRL